MKASLRESVLFTSEFTQAPEIRPVAFIVPSCETFQKLFAKRFDLCYKLGRLSIGGGLGLALGIFLFFS